MALNLGMNLAQQFASYEINKHMKRRLTTAAGAAASVATGTKHNMLGTALATSQNAAQILSMLMLVARSGSALMGPKAPFAKTAVEAQSQNAEDAAAAALPASVKKKASKVAKRAQARVAASDPEPSSQSAEDCMKEFKELLKKVEGAKKTRVEEIIAKPPESGVIKIGRAHV